MPYIDRALVWFRRDLRTLDHTAFSRALVAARQVYCTFVNDWQIHAPWRMSELEQQAAGCVIGRDYPAPAVEHERSGRVTLERYARSA